MGEILRKKQQGVMIQNNNEIKQLGISSILAYHLLPGIPIFLLAILFANPVWRFGLPIFLSLMKVKAVK